MKTSLKKSTTIEITQHYEVDGIRIKPLEIKIDNVPKWFMSGDVDAITVIRKPPTLIWVALHLYLLLGKAGIKIKLKAVSDTINATNHYFDELISKYQQDPMMYVEEHLYSIPNKLSMK